MSRDILGKYCNTRIITGSSNIKYSQICEFVNKNTHRNEEESTEFQRRSTNYNIDIIKQRERDSDN